MPVAIYEQPSTRTLTPETRGQASRPQISHAAQDALKVNAGMASHLRNLLGLVLVVSGGVGLMYLICGSFAR